MIKDVFKFRKKSWHARLMKFVWGYDPEDFRNMCPYFWLSVVNVIALPVILIIMLFVGIVIGIKKITEASQASIDRACETKVMKWVAQKTEKWWDDEDLVMSVGKRLEPYGGEYYFCGSGSKDEKYRKFFESLTPEDRRKLYEKWEIRWNEIKAEARAAEKEQYERRQKEEERLRQRNATRAVRIGKATVVIKTVFKIIVWPILAGLAYLLFLLIVKATTWDYSWMSTFFYVLYVVLGTGLGIGLLIYAAVVFIRWIECKLQGVCIPCEARRKKIAKFFKFCFGWLSFFAIVKWPFIWIARFFVSIWKGIVFLKDILVAFKQNNCPAIEWED